MKISEIVLIGKKNLLTYVWASFFTTHCSINRWWSGLLCVQHWRALPENDIMKVSHQVHVKWRQLEPRNVSVRLFYHSFRGTRIWGWTQWAVRPWSADNKIHLKIQVHQGGDIMGPKATSCSKVEFLRPMHTHTKY